LPNAALSHREGFGPKREVGNKNAPMPRKAPFEKKTTWSLLSVKSDKFTKAPVPIFHCGDPYPNDP